MRPPTEPKKPANDKPETAGLVIWHWRDQRLPTQQRVEEQRDRDRSFLAVLRVPERTFARLADDDLPEVTSRRGRPLRHRPRSPSLRARRHARRPPLPGRVGDRPTHRRAIPGRREAALVLRRQPAGRSRRSSIAIARSGATTWRLARQRNLTAGLPTTFVDEESDVNVIDPPVTPPGWTEDGESVLLADNWDVWRVPVAGGAGATRHADHAGRQGARHPLPPRRSASIPRTRDST